MQKYNYQMSKTLQQIKEATKRKTNGLFFIKSKHAHPTFKNHSYFQMKLRNKASINSQQNDTYQDGNKNLRKWKMFVNEPSSFGIQNTVKYMCSNATKKRSIQAITSLTKANKTQNSPRMSIKIVQNPLLNNKQDNEADNNLNNYRLKSEPTNKYLQTTQSFNYRIRKYTTLKDQTQTEDQLSKYLQKKQILEHMIQMIYIRSAESYYDTELNQKIQVNILPYIINCFLKCKVNFHKTMQQTLYNEIVSFIGEAEAKKKLSTYLDTKDLINVSSINQIFQSICNYKRDSAERTQIIKYFFIPPQQVLKYQFQKLIDEIKIMSVLKFNAEFFNSTEFYIYRVEDNQRVFHIYDLLKPGTYIFGQYKNISDVYHSLLKKRSQIFSFNNRIKRWRSIAPLDQTEKSVSDRKNSTLDKDQSLEEKYSRIYNIRKERRKKFNHSFNQKILEGKIKTADISMNKSVNGILITNQNSPNHGVSAFIDKSKLNRSEDIFQ